MEIKKPENYQPGGQEMLNKKTISKLPQLVFVLFMIIWVVSAIFVSIVDIFNGFQHNVLTVSFISTIIVGLYLKIKDVIANKKVFPGITNVTKTSGCSKCGGKKKK